MTWPPYRTLLVFALLLLPASASADTFSLQSAPRTGHIDYAFIGAPMVNNDNLSNGVNCLMPQNSATVTTAQLSSLPTLVSATLYISGSLIDDQLDYLDPNVYIFNPPPNLEASNGGTDLTTLLAYAQASAAVSVDFQPPGASAPITVSTEPSATFLTVYYISAGVEKGNVAFFTTPIDVTSVMQNQGQGVLAGTYTVSNLLADVCLHLEAVCGSTSNGTCAQIHDNGTASFALLLEYEDPALPLHSVSVYVGQQMLFGDNVSVQLVNGSSVSNPASGSLSVYVQEGDITIGGPDSSTPCGGQEYITVTSTPNPNTPICLNDADNPVGNIWNGTINTVAAEPNNINAPPACTRASYQCCEGPHLCGTAGIDIDRYDISAALAPGATEINVTLATNSDRVAVAAMVVGVDVYAPILNVDSQFRVFAGTELNTQTQIQNGNEQIGAVLTYSLAISNTGNVAANGVAVHIDAPTGVTGFKVLDVPAGVTNNSGSSGGANGTGVIQISGLSVPAGKIAEVRFQLTTDCSLLDQTLALQAQISGELIDSFNVSAPTLVGGGPGAGACIDIDPNGPFALIDPVRHLRGGGCSAAGPALLPLLMGTLGIWLRSRRRRWLLAVGLMLGGGCAKDHVFPPSNPPAPQRLPSLTGAPGTPCGTNNEMVTVTNPNGSTFCIDRFEASLDNGALGNAQQSSDDTVTNVDGSTLAKAQVALASHPAIGVSWYQAKSACLNAGKHLCTLAEWEQACRGANLLIYPYGNQSEDSLCNGFFQYYSSNPAETGSFKDCVSIYGAYDLSGNVEEWLDTPVPRQPGTTVYNDRALHGGSYMSNSTELECVGVEYHAPPSSTEIDRGFRCCL